MHVHHVQKYLNMLAISESISDEQKQITENKKKHRNATATPQQFQENVCLPPFWMTSHVIGK